jgi:hypothetical protein
VGAHVRASREKEKKMTKKDVIVAVAIVVVPFILPTVCLAVGVFIAPNDGMSIGCYIQKGSEIVLPVVMAVGYFVTIWDIYQTEKKKEEEDF